MASSLLALLDDITTLLDDVAVLSKVAVKKTSGVVGDDLALNAEQVTGFQADRELPVVWAVAKGSFVNKLILVPAALLISAFAPALIVPLLMIGGIFLCYEGVEKLAHKFLHKDDADAEQVARTERVAALANPEIDLVALERTRIKGAIRTDFILSAEIVVIALGTMATAPMVQQIGALSVIGIGITVLVYGLVGGIVKLDDLGIQLTRAEGSNAAAASSRAFGAFILRMAPWLMRSLSVVGTAAMFLVGGQIIVHGVPAAEHVILAAEHGSGAFGGVVKVLLDGLVGVLVGAVVVAVVTLVRRLRGRRTALPVLFFFAFVGTAPLAAQQSNDDPEVVALNARRTAGDTVGLVEKFEQAIARLDARGVRGDRSTFFALQGLSNLLYQRRAYPAALRIQERATPLIDSLAGPEHSASAQEWHNLGFLRGSNNQIEGAIAAYEHALAVRQRVLPPGDNITKLTQRQLATSLRQRARARLQARDIVGTWTDADRALMLTDASDGPQSQPSIEAIALLVQLYQPLTESSDSRALMQIGPARLVEIGDRAVALLRREFGADDPRVRTIAANMETLRTGAAAMTLDPRAVLEAAQRAVTAATEAYGPNAEETAQTIVRLGISQRDLRDFPAARASFERALAIYTRLSGENSARAAEVYRQQGELARAERKLPEARALLERALAVAERAVGTESPQLAPYLTALANLFSDLGDTQQSRAMAARATRVGGAAVAAAGTPEAAMASLELASQAEARGNIAEARRLREEALRVVLPLYGEDHILVGALRFGLARNLLALGDLDGAERLVRQGMQAASRTFGEESSDYAAALAGLADVQTARNDLPAAEATLRRIVALNDRSLGAGHPMGFTRRFDLAGLLHAQRRHAEATTLVLETATSVDRYAREVLPTLAVAEQQAFLESTLPLATTFILMSARSQPKSTPQLYNFLGGWKGLLLRGIDRQAAVARLANDPRARTDVARLSTVRTELSSLTQRATTMEAAAFRTQRDRLTAEKEQLERRLAALVPETPDVWAGSTALQSALPERTAFVDFFRHGGGERARYSALVTVAGRAPVEVDLGPAQRLEGTLLTWRRAVTGDQFGIDEFWAVMRQGWDPIAAVLPDSLRFIWVSPDAQLSRLPWATLSVYNQRTAVANAAQVPSARALVTLLNPAKVAARQGVVLVGGVDFEAGTASGTRPSTRWTALPGTGTEVAAIKRLADSVQTPARTIAGAAATPRAVTDALRSARVAHLATHGFFFGESEAVYNSRGVVGTAPASAVPLQASRNPLAESGLALAGANVTASGNLTAEEILALDLRGLELVVLSACETGRGAEVTGQGVLGLQASLLAAGTKGMLMSLWKVPDASTAFLMERFYAYYLDGYSAPTALRDAQRDVLQREEFKNPVHWAGWVYVGPIDG